MKAQGTQDYRRYALRIHPLWHQYHHLYADTDRQYNAILQ